MSVTKTQTGGQGKGPSGNKPVAAGASSESFGDKLKNYWQTLVYEWRKITWPDRKQWKDSTIVVFVFTIVLMIVLATFDLAVGKLVNMILGLDRPV